MEKQDEQERGLQQSPVGTPPLLDQKEVSQDKEMETAVETEVQKKVGGKSRKVRKRTLSATSMPSTSGSESRKSQSPVMSPSTNTLAVKTRRSARSTQLASISPMEQVVKRKRSPKIVSNEIESGPDKKRKVSPEEPVGDADIGKLNHVAELDAKDKSKKRRPVTRSRSSKTTKDLKEDDSVGDQPSESVCDDTEQDKEPVSNEGTDTAQIKEVQPSIGTSSELTLQSQVENTIEDVIVDSVQDTPKSPQLEVFRRSSVCSAGSQGDIASPKLKISPLSGGSPVAPAFSPSISPTTRSPLEQEPLYGQRPTNVLSPKGSAASDDSKGSVLEGDNVAPSQFDRMLTDVRKITERHQNSLEKSGKSPILTVGAALSSMSSLSQKFSVTSPPPPPLERGNSMEQTSDQGCKTKSTGRYPHDRSSSLPPSISSSPPNVLQHQGPQTTPTSPTGFPMTATSPPLALTKPVRKPSTESSETLPTMPKSPEPSKEKSTPVDTSSFSIPLNQGPSMAAQSASYFLTGTPPVQGLEFRSQPPTTPHTQVFAFYPSDTLIRPKTSSEEAQANIVTHTQQNAITTPSVTAPPNTNTPPPPPLISTHKSMFPVGESPASSTSAGIHPVVMPQIHASISAGKQYSQYPTIPQDQMHLPMYSLVHVHPHHPGEFSHAGCCICSTMPVSGFWGCMLRIVHLYMMALVCECGCLMVEEMALVCECGCLMVAEMALVCECGCLMVAEMTLVCECGCLMVAEMALVCECGCLMVEEMALVCECGCLMVTEMALVCECGCLMVEEMTLVCECGCLMVTEMALVCECGCLMVEEMALVCECGCLMVEEMALVCECGCLMMAEMALVCECGCLMVEEMALVCECGCLMMAEMALVCECGCLMVEEMALVCECGCLMVTEMAFVCECGCLMVTEMALVCECGCLMVTEMTLVCECGCLMVTEMAFVCECGCLMVTEMALVCECGCLMVEEMTLVCECGCLMVEEMALVCECGCLMVEDRALVCECGCLMMAEMALVCECGCLMVEEMAFVCECGCLMVEEMAFVCECGCLMVAQWLAARRCVYVCSSVETSNGIHSGSQY